MKKRLLWYPYHFIIHYIPNHLINKIPFYFVRHAYYKWVMGLGIDTGSSIHMNTFINKRNIKIGKNSAINRNCYLDGRGGLIIGNNVSISPEVHLITAQHNVNDPSFSYVTAKIEIEDFVWIGTRATILPGVHLGKGCVVAAGAVVTKSFPEFSIIGGIPAKIISKRIKNVDYTCRWMPPFD